MTITQPYEALWRPEPEITAPDAFYDVAYRKWKQQQDDIDSIDRKGFSLFTIAALMLTTVLATIRLRSAEIPPTVLLPTISGFVLFAVALSLLLRVVRVRDYTGHPDTADLFTYAERKTDRDCRVWLAAMYAKAFDENQPTVRDKGRQLGRAFAWVGGEAVLLALGLIVSFL